MAPPSERLSRPFLNGWNAYKFLVEKKIVKNLQPAREKKGPRNTSSSCSASGARSSWLRHLRQRAPTSTSIQYGRFGFRCPRSSYNRSSRLWLGEWSVCVRCNRKHCIRPSTSSPRSFTTPSAVDCVASVHDPKSRRWIFLCSRYLGRRQGFSLRTCQSHAPARRRPTRVFRRPYRAALGHMSESLKARDCAQFCAHPTSKTIADGGSRPGEQIARTDTENQHHSKSSHSVGKTSAATVNRRVASSNLARGAKILVSQMI